MAVNNHSYKKILRSSQDLNLGLQNTGQMVLPTEPLEFWYWSRGLYNSHFSEKQSEVI